MIKCSKIDYSIADTQKHRYPDSILPSGQRWPNVSTSVGPTLDADVGPTLPQRRQATGKNYVLCIASDNQIVFTNNFFSVNL